MGQIWTLVGPKPVNEFRRRGHDRTCKSMWRCDNVGGLGEHVTCHMFWFLNNKHTFFFLFTLFVGSRRARTGRPIFDDQYIVWRGSVTVERRSCDQ